MFERGGFYRGNAARDRCFQTASGKGEFAAVQLSTTGFADADGLFHPMALRSDDQFNTTIYGYSDRFRGVEGTRHIVFVNPRDVERLGLKDGEIVDLRTDYGGDVRREVSGLRVAPYENP